MARGLITVQQCAQHRATQADHVTELITRTLITTPARTVKGTVKITKTATKALAQAKSSIEAEMVWRRALKKAGKADRARARWIPSRAIRLLLFACIIIANASALAIDEGTTSITLQNEMVSLGAADQIKSSTADIAHHWYDSESFVLAIDNCSTRSITNNMTDFVSPPRAVNVKVQGIAGVCAATYVGTVCWRIKDDYGVVHEWLIPNTYYNVSSPYRLLSPQHWAQERKEKRGSKCTTYFDAVELFWESCRHMRSIPLDSRSNIALIRSHPSYSKFHSFCNEIATADDVLDEVELLQNPCMCVVNTQYQCELTLYTLAS
jgi:hypothetical protein